MIKKEWKDTTRIKEVIKLVAETETIVFYDLETTGLSKKNDRILQFAAMRYDTKKGEVTEKINLFIKCPFSIPEKITEINHISDELLEEKGVDEEKAVELIQAFIKEGDVIAGYNNNSFDDKFMESLYSRYGKKFEGKESLDVYKFAKSVIPPECVTGPVTKTNKAGETKTEMKASYKLQTVTTYYKEDNDILFHDAYGDVMATIRVLENVVKDGKKYIDDFEKEESLRENIPRQDATILSISYFAPSQNIKRVYVNTSQGTIFYDEIRHEWRAKTGNINSLDMDGLKEKIFKEVGVFEESDLFKTMEKKERIYIA